MTESTKSPAEVLGADSAAVKAIARARGEQSPNHSDQKEVGNG